MKKKLRGIVPCLGLLVFFSFFNYQEVKTYYDDLAEYNGLQLEDFESQLKEENQRASENQREYNELTGQSTEEESEPNLNPVKQDLKLHARSALLLDAENDRVLYEENGFERMPMASTTKIMTCIVTLENGDLSDVVTVSSYAARQPDVQLNVRTGEQYYLKDLLYSLMLESHNDVAVAIAEHVGGSVEGFATMMNDKARSMGCQNTNFVTPNGLDAEGHYTTAKDLAIIASYAIKNDLFIRITNTASHQFHELVNHRSFSVSNKNRFLYMMDGAIGVKTGFTNGAGYCFVGAVKKSDRTLVSVVLGSGWPPSKNLKWTDTKTLMSYGIDHFEKRQIFRADRLDPIAVEDGKQKLVNLKLEGDMELLLGPEDTIDIEYDIPRYLKAPLNENTIAGYAKYFINEELYREIPIYITEAVEKIDFKYCFDQILGLWSLQY